MLVQQLLRVERLLGDGVESGNVGGPGSQFSFQSGKFGFQATQFGPPSSSVPGSEYTNLLASSWSIIG